MFKQDTTKYEDYTELGRSGGSFSQFYNLLPKGYQKTDSYSGEMFAGDKCAVSNFSFGLVDGGHLDKFREFYKRSKECSYADDIILYGLRAAVKNQNVNWFEEIKGMHNNPHKIEAALRMHMNGWNGTAGQLKNFDKLREQVKLENEKPPEHKRNWFW